MMLPPDPQIIVLIRAYAVLGDIRNQWVGRHTSEGQKLLCDLVDMIAAETGRDPEEVQNDYPNRWMDPPDSGPWGEYDKAADA